MNLKSVIVLTFIFLTPLSSATQDSLNLLKDAQGAISVINEYMAHRAESSTQKDLYDQSQKLRNATNQTLRALSLEKESPLVCEQDTGTSEKKASSVICGIRKAANNISVVYCKLYTRTGMPFEHSLYAPKTFINLYIIHETLLDIDEFHRELLKTKGLKEKTTYQAKQLKRTTKDQFKKLTQLTCHGEHNSQELYISDWVKPERYWDQNDLEKALEISQQYKMSQGYCMKSVLNYWIEEHFLYKINSLKLTTQHRKNLESQHRLWQTGASTKGRLSSTRVNSENKPINPFPLLPPIKK